MIKSQDSLDVNVNVRYVQIMASNPKNISTANADMAPELSADTASWGIRDFAAMFEVTPRTIRFYETKGLLSPRRDNNVRVFGLIEHARFEKIMRAKRLGFTLDDIKEVLDVTDGHVKSRQELSRRKRNFETVIRSLQNRRKDIDILVQDMREICDVIQQHIELIPENRSDIAQDMSVYDLAAAYEAKFRQNLVDDFAPDVSSDLPSEINPFNKSTSITQTA